MGKCRKNTFAYPENKYNPSWTLHNSFVQATFRILSIVAVLTIKNAQSFKGLPQQGKFMSDQLFNTTMTNYSSLIQSNSTRRFNLRPDLVALSATGCSIPLERTARISRLAPCVIRY